MKINGKHVQFLTSGSTLAVAALVAMTVACSGGGDAASGFDGASSGRVASDVYGSFGGACVKTGSTTQPLVCSGSTYSGRALAAAANVGHLVVVAPIIDTGELPGAGGSLSEELLEASIAAPLVTTHVATSTTTGAGDATTSTARIDRTTMRVAGIDVVAGVIKTSAVARCTAGVVGYTPGFQIASLEVAGLSVLVDGSANQVVEVPGVLRVVINEQRVDGDGLTVAALHVSALSILPHILATDVVVAKSRANIDCGCVQPPGSSSGASGSSSGGSSSGASGSSSGGSSSGASGSSSGGSSSGTSGEGGSSSGGSSSGGSSSGTSGEGGSSSGASGSSSGASGGSSSGGSSSGGNGGPGAGCDTAHPCAEGLECAPKSSLR